MGAEKGWAFDISKFELRQDGVFLYSQTSPDGHVMWVKFIYHEVKAPEKLIYSSFFSDEKGNIVRAPFNENWPLETLNTFTFTENEGKTILTYIGTPVSTTSGGNENLRGFARNGSGGLFRKPRLNWLITSQKFHKTDIQVDFKFFVNTIFTTT